MLEAILDLESVDTHTFLARNHQENFLQSLFGGQVVAQALMAAAKTVVDRPPHSLHAYFLRPGTTQSPVKYQVTELRTGTSVSTREVAAWQNDKLIFTMTCSFHAIESGLEHQTVNRVEASAPPQDLPADQVPMGMPPNRRISEFMGMTPIDFWASEDLLFREQASSVATTHFWFRSQNTLASAIHNYAALAFASDIGVLATALLPHATSLFSGKVLPASIDHAIWFHRRPDFSRWHQYVTTSPWAGNARALCQGSIFDPQGLLVATIAQEGLIRLLTNTPGQQP